MSEPVRWIPDDAALDGLARELDPGEPAAERAEHNRTAILAAAATRGQQSRHSRAPIVMLGVVLAAAAIALVVIRTRPNEPSVAVKERITPVGVAQYTRASDWPDFVVRDDDGTLGIWVGALDAGDRFRANTADGVVETRGARFEITAAKGRLKAVSVSEGRAEVRWADHPVVILSAGEAWAPPQTAQRDELVAPPITPPVEAPIEPPIEPPARPVKADRPRPAKASTPETPAIAPEKPVQPPPAASPGEAEFRTGMAALRTGDIKAAQASFAAACAQGKTFALEEDACFWSGAAAKRAGDVPSARAALAAFLQAYPRSGRAPEASALLGWIMYDAGDLAAAEPLFRRAANDRVPQVRDSATRGLTAIERKRKTP